jgi:lipoic acid synthetase
MLWLLPLPDKDISAFWWGHTRMRQLKPKLARNSKPSGLRIRSTINTELGPDIPVDQLVPLDAMLPARPRLPEWLRKSATHHESVHALKKEIRGLKLHTVCESARCPNLHECFHRGAATFMILGNLCTRGCGFCSVPKASPHKQAFLLDPDEPANVARAAANWKLRYVVITSVNRDDLADGGSHHFAATVREVRRALPSARIEVLTPDFCGDLGAVARVLDAAPDVFNHNMETVARLYRRVRPQANYQQSLDVLRFAKSYRPAALTKSGLMVGLGEETSEVEQLLRDLRGSDVDVATLGQYLQPTRRNLSVASYVTPAQFEAYRDYGLSIGFKMVFSGPLVRSSYMADLVNEEATRATA